MGGFGTKLSSGKDPSFRHKGATRVYFRLGQCQNFHPTQRDKESHPRRVVTETKKGLEGYQG